MGTTQPIRDRKDLEQFLTYYKTVKYNPRNHTLIVMGIHTALRISDILNLSWNDVFDFERNCYRSHLAIQEHKTGKNTVIAINSHIKEALICYRRTRSVSPKDYLFTKNTNYEIPLSRTQAFRIIKEAASGISDQEHISCHSMRKTFGYYAWKQGTPPALLMDIYNHSSYQITKKYLGIGQDERDDIFLKIDIV